jgi:protein phosphatase
MKHLLLMGSARGGTPGRDDTLPQGQAPKAGGMVDQTAAQGKSVTGRGPFGSPGHRSIPRRAVVPGRFGHAIQSQVALLAGRWLAPGAIGTACYGAAQGSGSGTRANRHGPAVQMLRGTRMIEFGHCSHVGLRREHNEDTYYADGDLGLWLVADGMGGHEHGEIASALARDTLVREVRRDTPLVRAIELADEEIIRHSTRRSEALPMGTTIASLHLDGNNGFEVAWVGDSRVYLWDGTLRQLSQDHSYVQELIDQGAITIEQARSHPHRNVVTQALGVTDPESLRVESVHGELAAGMQILLCSDGLTEEVADADIAEILKRSELSAQECVDHLILAALDGGGSDNVTVVLVRQR